MRKKKKEEEQEAEGFFDLRDISLKHKIHRQTLGKVGVNFHLSLVPPAMTQPTGKCPVQ